MKKLLCTVLSLAFVLGLTACDGKTAGNESAATGDSVKIGFVAPLSAGQATYGELQLKGIQMAFDEINAAGGVLGGRPLELVQFDDKSSTTDAAAGAQKFADDPSIVAVYGSNNSGCTLAMAPVLQKARLLHLNSSSSAMALMDYDTFFRTLNDAQVQTAFSANWGYEEFGGKCIVVAVNNDWGKDMVKGFTSAYEALGGEVLLTEFFENGQSDYRSAVTRMKEYTDADFIYNTHEFDSCPALMQQMAELNLNLPTLGSTAFFNDLVLQSAGHDLDGAMFLTEFYVYDENPVIKEFVTKYQEKYNGELPAQQSANAYEAGYAIYYAIEKAGSTDREAIVQAAYEIEPFQGITGTIEWGGENGHTLIGKPYTKMCIKDGAYTLYAG